MNNVNDVLMEVIMMLPTHTVYVSDLNSCCPNTADESSASNITDNSSWKKHSRTGTGTGKKKRGIVMEK